MSAVSFGSFSSFLSHEYKPISQYYIWQIIVFLFLWGSLFVCFLFVLLQIVGLWQPCAGRSIGPISPKAFAHPLSPCHI